MAEDKPDKETKPSTSKRPLILLAVLILCFAIALTVGLVLHFELNDDDDNDMEKVDRSGIIVDCYPELRKEEAKMMDIAEACRARGCVYRRLKDQGAPWCIFPAEHGYRISKGPTMTTTGYTVELSRIASPQLFDTEVYDTVNVLVEMQTDNRVRVKIYPNVTNRWEIPSEALNIESTNNVNTNATTSLYNVTFMDNPFGIVVTRVSTGAVIFNTSLPGMVISDQFLQITTKLTNDYLYGFGEHRHESFRHNMNWRVWSMFTRDTGPNTDWNLYGHHPVYMNIEDDRQANMVLLKNTNAMEVMLQPSPDPAVTFRTIGGVLDFYIFLGDSPADALKHYVKAIGQPVFPPYWSLGFHLCRWGYTNISDMQAVINRNRAAMIPYESQWADIDTFHKAYVFSYDKENWTNFPALVNDLKAKNQHFVTIVDPGIGADPNIAAEVAANFPGYDILGSGEAAGLFVKTANDTTLIGEVWPGVTAFPDFTKAASQDWWTRWIRFYRDTVGVKVEALWIDMNEPASFVEGSVDGCAKNKWNYPPYVPHVDGSDDNGKLYVKTLCMDAKQGWSTHYNAHSLYAHSMAMRTYKSLEDIFPNKRPWTMTRSSYVGTGRYATKWQGDNSAMWSNMHYSIISLMEFGLFGFAMNGADICGFWLEPTYEMCVRWHQLGAFYPFARNHNGKGDEPELFKHQDPAAFGQQFIDLVKPALLTRYKFLPYLYTLMYRAHVDGEMVFKPLFFEFPHDDHTLTIDKQFMLGPAFLISPVMTAGARAVKAYFPEGRWFDYLTGEEISSQGQTVMVDTPLDKFNLHIRAGCIVPWQEPDVTTVDSRTNGLGLFIALNESAVANGELYWDDGESKLNAATPNYNLIKFEMKQAGELVIRPEKSGYATTLEFKTLEIYGLTRYPSEMKLNGNPIAQAKIKFFDNIVRVEELTGVRMTATTTITWAVY